MRYHILHTTGYRYASDVVHSRHLLHLVPRPAPYQQCIAHALEFSPAVYRRRDTQDAFGNPVTHVEFNQAHRHLEVLSAMKIDVHARPHAEATETESWERAAAGLAYSGMAPGRDTLIAARFRHESPHVRVKQDFNDYAADCFAPGSPALVSADALMAKIHAEFQYTPGETSVATPLLEVLRTRRGVCQDFAHLMIACLRSRGLAARYVSGYLRTARAAAEGGAELVGAAASHAWLAVYCPPSGWIELDPTNNTRVGTDHVAIAWGRDYGDVSPLRGVILGGGAHELSVSVSVTPIDDTPANGAALAAGNEPGA